MHIRRPLLAGSSGVALFSCACIINTTPCNAWVSSTTHLWTSSGTTTPFLSNPPRRSTSLYSSSSSSSSSRSRSSSYVLDGDDAELPQRGDDVSRRAFLSTALALTTTFMTTVSAALAEEQPSAISSATPTPSAPVPGPLPAPPALAPPAPAPPVPAPPATAPAPVSPAPAPTPPTPAPVTPAPAPDEKAKEAQPPTETPKAAPAPVAPEEEKAQTVTAAELKKEEKELVAELKAEQKDQQKVEKEADELIAQLEKQQKESAKSTTPAKSDDKAVEKTQQLIDKLEKDEETVEKETLSIIDKVEKLKAEAEQLKVNVLPEPSAKSASESVKASEQETNEFIEALKERSVENQDLIEMLKQKSKKYYNEKTGRYNSMSTEEFKQRKDEYMSRENAAEELMKRFGEGISTGEEILLQPDGLLDRLGKQAQKELMPVEQAVEKFLEEEDQSELLEKLRSRAKAVQDFSSVFDGFLNKLQSALGGDDYP